MSHEEFSPEQHEAIYQLIQRVDPYKNAMVFGQALLNISRQFRMNPMVYVENMLRRMGSDTYLLAVPMVDMDSFQSQMPHSDTKEYPYYLWIGVNGKEEAEEKMLEIETTTDQNLIDLGNTGMLISKPRSNLSNTLHSSLN